jgi:hypothetical protein
MNLKLKDKVFFLEEGKIREFDIGAIKPAIQVERLVICKEALEVLYALTLLPENPERIFLLEYKDNDSIRWFKEDQLYKTKELLIKSLEK